MIRTDFHIHTTFCDGKSTAEEVVLAAIEAGLETIGFSGHGYTAFDESYCMSRDAADYRREITRLREKYSDKIGILCGLEQDFYSEPPIDEFDYIIGSVHYLNINGKIVPVDENPDMLIQAAKKHFNGDFYALAEEYFRIVSQVVQKTNADIIGHFDLISKFNEDGKLFDEEHPRYISAYTAAIDALIESNKPFEINTGAISRGYRTLPYPSLAMMRLIAEKGGRFILSSDSHSAGTLCNQFERWEKFAADIGGKLVLYPK